MFVLLSKSVFPGTGDEALDGFVAIDGDRIAAVGPREEAAPYVGRADRVIDCGEGTVMAGMIDDHTFFSGWALTPDAGLGADLSRCETPTLVVEALAEWGEGREPHSLLLGYGLSPILAEDPETGAEALTIAFPDRPAVALTAGRDRAWLNEAATRAYGFAPDACWSEMIWKMMADYLAFPEIREVYRAYMAMLNRRGVTGIKEMAFDDYYGFDAVMRSLADDGELTVRVQLQSQPVGAGMDLALGERLCVELDGPFLSFGGYNRMTDRGMAGELAEMLDPYRSDPTIRVREEPEWALIERELRAADEAGFRYTLHCQGDAAVRHVVDLYETCRKDEDGRMVNRHGITDLESSRVEDLERLGEIGGVCEVYPQIQLLDDRDELLAVVDERLGRDRFARFWQRRQMEEAGCVVACGTDLPLQLPKLGDSLWAGAAGRFADGKAANEGNMLSVPQMLRAWTAGGAYDCFDEGRRGTLEAGKLADVIVLDRDVLGAEPDEYREIEVALTVVDGRVVWDAAEQG